MGEVELLGEDALDLLNLPYHFKRKPLGTSAVVVAAGLLLASRWRRAKDGIRPRGHRPTGVLEFAEGLLSSTVLSAVTAGIGPLAKLARYSGKNAWRP